MVQKRHSNISKEIEDGPKLIIPSRIGILPEEHDLL